jgi:hypothetical protein
MEDRPVAEIPREYLESQGSTGSRGWRGKPMKKGKK